MNYELKSSIHNKKISLPIKIVFIFIIILLILHFTLPQLLSSAIMIIVKPFWNLNRGLEPDINMLLPETQNIIISQLKKENIELKDMLGRKESRNLLIAYILKKPPFSAYDSFVLDVGTKDGVSIGDKVYASGNILIGDIAEVSYSSSKARLYSSYGTEYEIFIGEKNIQTKAIGRGGGTFEAVIPRDTKISEGDTISIPDISNSVFGVVGNIIADPTHVFSTVVFSQPINIYEQKWVLISLEKNK